jgi:hypothetical protein
MALLEIRVDLARVASALERIADSLERAIPKPREIDTNPAGVENLTQFSPEEEWEREIEEERQRAAGHLPGSRRRP